MDKRCVHCLPQGDASKIYGRREAVRRCAEVVGLERYIDGFEYDVGEDRGEVFLKAKLRVEPEKVETVRPVTTHLGARQGLSVPSPPAVSSASAHPENLTGSASYHAAVGACVKAAELPRPPERADAPKHVANSEQQNYLGARRLVQQEVVKWPANDAEEIAEKTKAIRWPRSARGYVKGQACARG